MSLSRTGGEAERRVVRHAMAASSSLTSMQEHSAEDLFLGNRHLVVHVSNDGRLDEVAGFFVPRTSRRPRQSPPLRCRLDIIENLLLLARADDWSHPAIVVDTAAEWDVSAILDDRETIRRRRPRGRGGAIRPSTSARRS